MEASRGMYAPKGIDAGRHEMVLAGGPGTASSAPMGLGLRDLRVWQESVALGADVIRSLRQTNRREIKAITEHTMVTAMQVAEHVAEGYGRYAPGEQRQLYREAKRHLLRLETSLAVARQADLLSATHHAQLSSRIQSVNRLLGGFLVYLDRQLDTSGEQGTGNVGRG